MTDMTNGVLCMIDFSESSREALRTAVSLAKLLNTRLTVLFPYRLLNTYNGEATDLKKKIEENAVRDFSVLEQEILSESGVPYEFKVEVGFVSNRVKDYAKKNRVSFVVMGNKMNLSNKESFDELAENIPMPLVIVP